MLPCVLAHSHRKGHRHCIAGREAGKASWSGLNLRWTFQSKERKGGRELIPTEYLLRLGLSARNFTCFISLMLCSRYYGVGGSSTNNNKIKIGTIDRVQSLLCIRYCFEPSHSLLSHLCLKGLQGLGSFHIFLNINLFTYFILFWLRWVFVAACGLSLVASGGYSSLRCAGFSLRWLLLLQSMGSRCVGFSSCGTRAQ